MRARKYSAHYVNGIFWPKTRFFRVKQICSALGRLLPSQAAILSIRINTPFTQMSLDLNKLGASYQYMSIYAYKHIRISEIGLSPGCRGKFGRFKYRLSLVSYIISAIFARIWEIFGHIWNMIEIPWYICIIW